MALKHRITINVTDPRGKTGTVLKGADAMLPARLVRFLFGDFTQVYLLKPGQTVESVDRYQFTVVMPNLNYNVPQKNDNDVRNKYLNEMKPE